MKQFVAGVPNITFINVQTREEIKMNYAMSYNKYGDEIDIDYAILCDKEYQSITDWIMNEYFVKVKFEFNIYHGDIENAVDSKDGVYTETYPVIMVYKPFVNSTDTKSPGTIEFKIKVRE